VWINGSPAGGIFPELNMPTTLKGILLQPEAKLTLKPGGDLTIEN
jgi:hypothetical protein